MWQAKTALYAYLIWWNHKQWVVLKMLTVFAYVSSIPFWWENFVRKLSFFNDSFDSFKTYDFCSDCWWLSTSFLLLQYTDYIFDSLKTIIIYYFQKFLFFRGGFRFVDALMDSEFYDGFLAKPPCVVHRKAYELSRTIPPILQVKLLSRSDIWDDIFHDECPHLADVSLYFFPSNDIERSILILY